MTPDIPKARSAEEWTSNQERNGIWHFPDLRPVTIVCAQLPYELVRRIPYADPRNPDYTEMYRYADLDALIELYGHIRAVNPITLVNIRLAPTLKPEDYSTHLVVLGGVDWNSATGDLLARLHRPVRQLPRADPPYDAYFEVVHGEQPNRFRPILAGSDPDPQLHGAPHVARPRRVTPRVARAARAAGAVDAGGADAARVSRHGRAYRMIPGWLVNLSTCRQPPARSSHAMRS